ncbi:hypothetical protein HOF67_05580 [Candidatus Peregrinibacteria bacterium]|jgi:hypothetical protein|nr:hypothetical protein [Candidatus Peregrinibacteria bacterium]
MHLREGEQILKVFHHHPTPYVFNVVKIIIGIFPFFLLLYLFGPTMTDTAYMWGHVIIIGIFVLILKHYSLVYWLDRLIITNQRVIYVNWRYLTMRDEDETELNDIQDIHTKEKGLLAALWIFDYGVFKLQTASHITAITFDDAPDPEGIRHYIYHIKPN